MRPIHAALVVALLVGSCTPAFTGPTGSSGGGGGGGGGAGAGTAGSAGSQSAAGDGGEESPGGGGQGGHPVHDGAGAGGTESSSAGEGGAGGADPDPSVVPRDGLVLWLRADHGVTEADGVVTQWLDSAYGIVAGQTATNQRPKLVGDALAGKPALVFDGQNDYLKLPRLDADFSRGASIIYAGRQSQKHCQSVFEASNGSEVDDLHLGSWEGYALYEVVGNVFHPKEYPLVPEEPEVLMGIQQTSGTIRLRRNALGLGEGGFETPAPVSRSEVFVGHSLYVDCGYFAGAIGELLVYRRALDDAEVVGVEAYLQQKWGCCTK